MRLYSSVRWFFQWYVGFTAVFAPYLYFVLRSYGCYMREAINSYSIKPLIGAYGASLFFALLKTVSDEGWAMVLCELAELAPRIRHLPATTTTQPTQRQRLFCLTWIALISCTLPGGERASSANGKDPRCCRSSEIDFVAVFVQQQYVIGFSLENFATKIFQGKGNF